MKKRSLFLVMLLFIAFVLVGCAKKRAMPNFDVPEEGYDGSKVTITFYHTMGTNLTPVLDTYIAEFNKIYPNITVNYESVGGYDDVRDRINTEITQKNQPNIAYCYPDHIALYNLAKAVVTLDNLIDSKIPDNNSNAGEGAIIGLTDEQKADFIEGYYEEGRQFGDGLMYSMPFSKSTEVLYYDKTFFEENNIKVPTTWDEMEDVCKKLKELDPNSIPLGYDSSANWFITMCEQLGTPYTSATGNHFLFDNAENRAFVKRFHEWYEKGYVTTQGLYGAYTSGLFISTDKIRSYMSIGSSAGATHQVPADTDSEGNTTYRFETGIATIPQANPQNPKVISQGPSVCIFKKDNPQEVVASWLFVKFLTTNVNFQAAFASVSGYIPVIKSVSENPVWQENMAKANGKEYIAYLSAKVCLEQEEAYYTSPAFYGSSKARDEVGALIDKVLPDTSKDIDAFIAKAFKDAIDECEYAI